MMSSLHGRQLLLVAMAVLGTAGNATAQSGRFATIGGGATFPIWEFDRLSDPGWVGQFGVGTVLGQGPWFALGTVAVGNNSYHSKSGIGETYGPITLRSVGGHLGLATSGRHLRLYGYAGGGFQRQRFRPIEGTSGDGDTKLLLNTWVGANFGRGSVQPWVQGGLAGAPGAVGDRTAYIGVMAGIRMGW